MELLEAVLRFAFEDDSLSQETRGGCRFRKEMALPSPVRRGREIWRRWRERNRVCVESSYDARMERMAGACGGASVEGSVGEEDRA